MNSTTITNKIERRRGEKIMLPKATRDGVPITANPTRVWAWNTALILRSTVITENDLKPFFGGPDWSFRSGFADDGTWTIHFSFGSEAAALAATLDEVRRGVYRDREESTGFAEQVAVWRERLRQISDREITG